MRSKGLLKTQSIKYFNLVRNNITTQLASGNTSGILFLLDFLFLKINRKRFVEKEEEKEEDGSTH